MSSAKKPLVVSCPTCGMENKISTPLCSSCGARLYVDGRYREVKEDPKRVARRRAIRTFILTWIVLTVVVVVGLIIWPHAAIDVPTPKDPSFQVQGFLTEVGKRRETQVPVPRTVFSQNNLNSYFGQHNNPDEKKYSGILLSETKVLLVTNEPFGPFDLSTRLVLEPEPDTETPFVPSKFWVGHLPLPTKWATGWTKSLTERFGFDLDQELWGEIQVLGVISSGLVIDVKWETP